MMMMMMIMMMMIVIVIVIAALCWVPHVHHLVRSFNRIIVTNRVQAPNLAQMFLRVYKINLEGVPRDPNFRGRMARGSISVDQFQLGNETDQSLCTFTCAFPANVVSNFGTNVLMGM